MPRVTVRTFLYKVSFRRHFGDFYSTSIPVHSIRVDGEQIYYCKDPKCVCFNLMELKKQIWMEIRTKIGD